MVECENEMNDSIVSYTGRNNHGLRARFVAPLFLRLLLVLLIQFGMACLGAPLLFNVIDYLVNDYMRAEWCWEEHAGKRL